ncbi:DUF397 domain-containing protein [Streptomyces sp. NPDC049954]|uniref:DUF397 domain-containing protein n=1 Tax=Streptomyces sp. NPDC049954 TaxID=3155779 RepID=UPI0034497A70
MNSADLTGVVWRKSSRSNGDANCVEVALLGNGRVAMRDTKHDGRCPALSVGPGEWVAFERYAVEELGG